MVVYEINATSFRGGFPASINRGASESPMEVQRRTRRHTVPAKIVHLGDVSGLVHAHNGTIRAW